MENGHEGQLAENMSGLGLNDSGGGAAAASNDSLFQVMKAVEAAEATIKQQVDENNRLRIELQRKSQELERLIKSHDPNDQTGEHVNGPNEVHQSAESLGIHDGRIRSMVNTSGVGSRLVTNHDDTKVSVENPSAVSHAERRPSGHRINGTLKILPGGQMPVDSTGLSQLSSPSTTSFSPSSEYDARINLPGRGLMQMAEVSNSNSLWKQDVAVKYQEHEEEIIQLRKYLTDFTMKEAQVRNEKYALEKRIAYMRLAFDQQQQDLVDAASKALSYRQDIIEENVRLTYELQATQQERSTFVSSLLPLLSEYSLQPPVTDAQSIVSNIRILFRHLQEKLNHTESKLKEFQYQLAPWHHDAAHSNSALRSPSHPDAAFMTPSRNGLDLVPQPTYSPAKVPVSSTDSQVTSDWDSLSHHRSGLAGAVSKNVDQDVGNYSPLGSRGHVLHDYPGQSAPTRDEAHAVIRGEHTPSRQVMFRDTVSNSDLEDPDSEGNPSEREPPTTWGSGNSPYSASMNDPSSSYSPYLPPVLEEPSSSFSEAADDDPLPAIRDMQISGEAFPGRELQACGYSINGTTSCNFEWVRHLEDGSVNYIDGAKQPNYLVTADDVDTYLAIEVQPLDDRKRKGELVKVFANEHRKITFDPEMQNSIEKTLYSGHASYKVSLPTVYENIWEPATLSIKREGYSIKCSSANGVLVTEKFSPNTSINIPFGQANEFIIFTSNGSQHLLRVDNSTDNSSLRETIVLTFRLFMIRAAERRKGKKRSFFNK